MIPNSSSLESCCLYFECKLYFLVTQESQRERERERDGSVLYIENGVSYCLQLKIFILIDLFAFINNNH